MSRRKPAFWTASRRARLAELYGEGKTDGQIARALGTTRRAVACKRSKQGLVKAARGSKRSVSDYATATLMQELRKRGARLGAKPRKLADYTTGTLLTTLRTRGYSVKIAKVYR